MAAPFPTPASRPRFQGMLDVLQYNRHQYVAAALVLGIGAAALVFVPLTGWIRDAGWAALGLAGYWALASLAVSHWIYDLSGIYHMGWACQQLPPAPAKILILHAGVDDSTLFIHDLYPHAELVTGDFYQENLMGEPSIREARKLRPIEAAARVNHADLPFDGAVFDLIMLVFAAHELRLPAERRRLLTECHRVLKRSGRVVIVEHLRDTANFAAFGPGFLHFHSRTTWLEDFAAAGFVVVNEIKKTPFVRAFILAGNIA